MERSAVSALVSFIAASTFAGAAFAWDVPSKRLSPTPPPSPSAGEPDIAASADGRTIYAAFAQNASGNTSIFGVCSSNQGTSFTSPVLLADTAGGDASPRVVTGYEPTTQRLLLHLAWHGDNGLSILYRAFSAPLLSPCSLTAETPVILTTAAGGFAGISIATDGADETYLATSDCVDVTGDCDVSNKFAIQLFYILNETPVTGYGVTDPTFELCREPDLAVAGGFLFLTYACDPVGGVAGEHEIRTQWSDNDGLILNGLEAPIAGMGTDMRLPAIAAHDEDTLYLAYAADAGGQEDLNFVMGTRTGSGVTWDTGSQQALNAGFVHELDIASLPRYGVATVVWSEDTIFSYPAIRSASILNTGATLTFPNTVSDVGAPERWPRAAMHPAYAVWHRPSDFSAQFSRDLTPTAILADRLRAVWAGRAVSVEGFVLGGAARVLVRREGWSAQPPVRIDGSFEAVDTDATGEPYFVDVTSGGRTETYGPVVPEEKAAPSCSAVPRAVGPTSLAVILLAALALCCRR